MARYQPHMGIVRESEGEDSWCCKYCGESGTREDIYRLSCNYNYKPCEGCGEVISCTLNCTMLISRISKGHTTGDGFSRRVASNLWRISETA